LTILSQRVYTVYLGIYTPTFCPRQAKACDLVHNLVNVLQQVRSDEHFDVLYDRAVKIALTIEVLPSKPRTVGRQRHRANADPSISSYYKVNYYFPFLDHVICHLNNRFSSDLSGALHGTVLMPHSLVRLTPEIETLIRDEFMCDLPAPHEFTQELMRWKSLHSGNQPTVTTLSDAVETCNSVYYLNISTIFQLILSLPVGSCSCERSFNSLRRLKTWSRTSMKEDRLNGMYTGINISTHWM
jgi:hypothetical protein